MKRRDFLRSLLGVAAAPYIPAQLDAPMSKRPAVEFVSGAFAKVPDEPFVFGMRKLISAYAGPVLRVGRESDNTEVDIGFVNDPEFGTVVDSDAILSFVGEGRVAYVAAWYDQSGNNNHWRFPVVSRRPRIAT